MKKIITIALIITVILALGGFMLSFSDALENVTNETMSENDADYYFIKHNFSKGSDLNMTICVDKEVLSEELMQLRIAIQQDKNNSYKICRLKADITSDLNAEFIERFVSYGNGQYVVPETDISKTARRQILNGDDYIYYTAIIRRNEFSENMTLDISYNIQGINQYFINSFNGMKKTIQI